MTVTKFRLLAGALPELWYKSELPDSAFERSDQARIANPMRRTSVTGNGRSIPSSLWKTSPRDRHRLRPKLPRNLTSRSNGILGNASRSGAFGGDVPMLNLGQDRSISKRTNLHMHLP